MRTFHQWLESWESFLPHNRQRQRTFPFARDQQWNRKPDSYVDQSIVGGFDSPYSLDNLYHVTTNIQGVKTSGRLLSRDELGTAALGGGPSNLISATHSYSRAVRIYDDLQFLTMVASGKIPASGVLDRFSEVDEEAEEQIDLYLRNFVPRSVLDSYDKQKIDSILNKKIRSPKRVYEFLQNLERIINDVEMSRDHENFSPLSITGFVADFEDIARIDPNQIAIIQLAARKDAKPEHVHEEEELRFHPDEIKIVRYLRPH